MKKAYFRLALILLLALSLCAPALALAESDAVYEDGVIYDETGELGSQTLTMQNEQTLPQLSEMLGIDLRVDVLTQIVNDSIGDTARGIYSRYNYGYGKEKEGVTLTIFLEPQDTGSYAMPAENGWCIYANLSEERGSSQDLADAVRDAVAPWMAERAWNGEDITMSATALTQAVDAMAEAASDYILANGPKDSSGTDAGAEEAEAPEEEPEKPETPQEPEASEQSSVNMQYVFDISDLLSYEEWEELETRAETLTQRHHCGIYFVLLDDYTVYGAGDIYETTSQLYHNSQLGFGDDRDGIIVLISMEERDYAMFVYGEYAEYAFNPYGQEKLEEVFWDDLGNYDWYGGISHYLDACDEYLTKAADGKPVRAACWPRILMVTGLSCLAAGAVCLLLMRGMKTVRQKAEADAYITEGGLNLTEQYDQYTHTTQTRTRIEKESAGGSGTNSRSSGGGSGRSGKF